MGLAKTYCYTGGEVDIRVFLRATISRAFEFSEMMPKLVKPADVQQMLRSLYDYLQSLSLAQETTEIEMLKKLLFCLLGGDYFRDMRDLWDGLERVMLTYEVLISLVDSGRYDEQTCPVDLLVSAISNAQVLNPGLSEEAARQGAIALHMIKVCAAMERDRLREKYGTGVAAEMLPYYSELRRQGLT
jgi:hypothetical protein